MSSTGSAAKLQPEVVPGVPSKKDARLLLSTGLKGLGHVPRGARYAPHIVGFSRIPIEQAIPTISADINHFWSALAAKNNVQWPQVQEVLVTTTPTQTQCSSHPSVAPTDPIFICAEPPSSGQSTTIYWTVPFIQQRVDTDPGRVNLSFTMAMMWSYQVQNLVGDVQSLQQGKTSNEAFADHNACLTGIYVGSIGSRSMSEKGDSLDYSKLLANLAATFGIGSSAAAWNLGGPFLDGIANGDLGSCINGGAPIG
jgi:hypothetical protein